MSTEGEVEKHESQQNISEETEINDIMDLTPQELREKFEAGIHVDEPTFVDLLRKFKDTIDDEDNILYLESPAIVIGDIHGQLLDLFKLFDKITETIEGFSFDNPKGIKLVFMGDYVDRGYQSLETFAYLAYLKVKYPDTIHLLRGNHESRQVNQLYGLFNDCQMIYGHAAIWFLCNDAFDQLPIAAVIDDKIYCVHGGLSPDLVTVEKISLIKRRIDLPQEGEFTDCCWSDPLDVREWTPNRRGAGYDFGEKQVDEFLSTNGFEFIARSHQLANDGFQWFWDNKLVIVWSAPNYMYRSGNEATFMYVEEKTENYAEHAKFIKFDKDERSATSNNPNDPGTALEYFA